MKVSVHIDLELPPKGRPSWIRTAAVAAVLLLGGGIAYAASWTVWSQSQPLSHDDLNGNFQILQQQVAALQGFQAQMTLDGGYSPSAVFCGYTAAVQGNVGGYAGAAALCRGTGVTGACSTSSAHMCTAEELLRTAQAGLALPAGLPTGGGWYSNALYAGNLTDCVGWTTDAGSSSVGGPWWSNQNQPNANFCNSPAPVLCCN